MLQPACGDKQMMKECVCATWACCALLAEGRGLETIGPKMPSSSVIGPAQSEPLPSPSGASEEEWKLLHSCQKHLDFYYFACHL